MRALVVVEVVVVEVVVVEVMVVVEERECWKRKFIST